jgi:hypothetical protein
VAGRRAARSNPAIIPPRAKTPASLHSCPRPCGLLRGFHARTQRAPGRVRRSEQHRRRAGPEARDQAGARSPGRIRDQVRDDHARRENDPPPPRWKTIRSIMENRVNSTGVSEPIVETVGSNEVLVQVPGASDPNAIRKLVGRPGRSRSFCCLLTSTAMPRVRPRAQRSPAAAWPSRPRTRAIDPSLPAQFTGKQLDPGGISAAADPNSPGNWLVNFAFSGQAGSDFSTWTGQHVNDYFAIVLDGVVQGSAPLHQEPDHGRPGPDHGQIHRRGSQTAGDYPLLRRAAVSGRRRSRARTFRRRSERRSSTRRSSRAPSVSAWFCCSCSSTTGCPAWSPAWPSSTTAWRSMRSSGSSR